MTGTLIEWAAGEIRLTVDIPADAPARLAGLSTTTGDHQVTDRLQPLVELLVLGEGHSLTNTRFSNTLAGNRLRYADHTATDTELRIRQSDPVTGLEVTTVFQAEPGVPATRTWTEVVNRGAVPKVIQMVSSFAASPPGDRDVNLMRARSDWCAEGRWATIPLRGPDGLADINSDLHFHDGRGQHVTSARSTWSSAEFVPVGILHDTATDVAWAWQIEHNGGWRWEVDGRRDHDNAYGLIVTGPNDSDHQWAVKLAGNEQFVSVPVSVAVSDDGWQGALAGLTRQRRASRRPHPADDGLPLIFNDYMNTLMGEPTTELLLPLIDAAAAAGAEYFCIDAGWYSDEYWWDSVGEWEPATGRFPDGGLKAVLDYIRGQGLRPGLWLEPEVVGVRSPIADKLPVEAFMSRHGERVVEHSRYLLDLRHPAARAHLDEVVDRLINDYGARYFKLDYNVTPGPGTDRDALQPGTGLLEHNRAHLAWLDGVLDRHPEVIFENCSSGAMRSDYALLSRLDLQSTSDQQDFRLYAAIAAAAPATMLPEQAGNWAYPEAGQTDEEIAFTMVNGLAGRLYLSGYLNRMGERELALIREAVEAHKRIRADVKRAEPFWPVGLPAWDDDLIVLGLRAPDATYLAVWWRGAESTQVSLDVAGDAQVVYPAHLTDWQPRTTGGHLELTTTPGPAARLFRLDPTPRQES
ncbi:glycoside hydrolase family 36 protein [Symbioplanes lichenis]|uniref:glycoside hydrolase family 36 protein n=1 Tax=Symbioplanes lichenis TaxID=1629072 RepID=UPI002738EEDF|nr:alpha-galactosidase [Actinoplanes lichenis]